MSKEHIIMTNIVSISNLKKYFDNGETKALDGINLNIKRGEFVSIIGPSGSGKSTLLNMIGALDTPDSGSIIVDNIDLTDKKENLSKFRSQKIGFIFQLHNLIPNLNVLENVTIPIIGKSLRVNRRNKKRAEEILESVGLSDKLTQHPTKMSGGQRQRVAIARALVNNPSIIIADEPTGALDTKTSKMIMNLLKNLHRERNVTLIVVTHDPSVAHQADRIITVRDGKLLENEDNNLDEDYTTNINNNNSIDFVNYISDTENKFGTQLRKTMKFNMDNKVMEILIRPLTSSEILKARKNEEEGKGTFQEFIVQYASSNKEEKTIPLEIIQNKIPSGIVDQIAEKIIEYTRYGFK